jgi:uncharacterized protein (TIGR03437 family)
VLEPVKRRIERTLVHLQNFLRDLLDAVRYGPPVHRAGLQSPQDEKIQGSLKKIDTGVTGHNVEWLHYTPVVVGCQQQKMSPDGSSILYSTFLGGTGNDRWYTSLALDNTGAAYLSGLTGSTNFPVPANTFQPKYGGARNSNDPKGDGWVAKISGLFPPQTPVTPPAPVTPPITVTSVANAASLAQGGVAPGEIVVIAGTRLGPAMQVAGAPDPTTGLLATSVGGASVLFDGVAAPLVNASATRLTAIVPYEIANRNSTQMKVSFSGQTSAPMTLTVAPSFPGLFSADSTGAGQALASNADSSPNSAANPANTADVVTLNGTGEGQTDPPGVDGQIANDTLPQPVLALSVTIGGSPPR